MESWTDLFGKIQRCSIIYCRVESLGLYRSHKSSNNVIIIFVPVWYEKLFNFRELKKKWFAHDLVENSKHQLILAGISLLSAKDHRIIIIIITLLIIIICFNDFISSAFVQYGKLAVGKLTEKYAVWVCERSMRIYHN